MPLADAGVRLPRRGRDLVQHAAFAVEYAHPLRRILKPFTVVNRFHFSAAPFGAQVIQVRYQTETVVFEWQIPIRVQQVRLVVIDKIFDAHIPVALPPSWYVALVPKGIAEIAEDFVRSHIKSLVLGIGSVVGTPCQRPRLVRAMTYRKPLIGDP